MKGLIKFLFLFLFFFSTLWGEAFLQGDFLTVKNSESLWELIGNVSLQNQKYHLKSQKMHYYRKLKKIIAQGEVRVSLLEENKNIEGFFFEKEGKTQIFRGEPVRVTENNGEKQTLANTLKVQEKNKEKIFIFLGQVKVIEKESIISAEKLTYHDQEKKAFLEDNAKIEKPLQEIVLESQKLVYDEKNKKAFFETPVKIQKKDALITGNKGEYNEKDDLITLTGQVLYHEKNKNRLIKANKLDTIKEKEEKVFVFKDQIEITDGDFLGSCHELDYLEKKEIMTLKGDAKLKDVKKELEIESNAISFDQKKDQIYFLGRVVIVQKDKTIAGNMGVYDKKTSSIVVQGSPYYRKGLDSARAERIILNTDTNEVQMIGNFQGSFGPN